jgi:hypothetical protein
MISPTVYLLILLSFFFNWTVGFLICRNQFFSLPIGSFFLGTLISLLCRFIPGQTLFIVKLICLFSALFITVKYFKFDKMKKFLIKKNFLKFSLIFCFFLIFLKNFHYRFITYETHDVLYFSPTIELYLSDYVGNLKTLTYFPSNLTGHPNFPASVMSALMIFVNKVNLVSVLEARYIFLSLLFSLILFYLMELNSSHNILKLFISFVFSLYLFENFIGHSIIYSGVFGVFILFFVFLIIFFKHDNEDLIKSASYLSIFLCMTKPGVSFMFWIFPIYFYFSYIFVRKDYYFYFFGSLVFLNYLTWIILPVTIGNTFLSLFNPLEPKDYFYTFLTSSWFKNGIFFETLNNFFRISEEFQIIGQAKMMDINQFIQLNFIKIILDLFEFINLLIVSFVASFILLKKLNFENKKIINYFLLFSFLIYAFLRHENIYGNKTVEQAVHVMHYIAVLSVLLLTQYLTQYFRFRSKITLVIILFFILNSQFTIFYGTYEFDKRKELNEYVLYNELNRNINKDSLFYQIDENISSKKILLKEELKATLYGMRIKNTEFDKFEDNKLRPYMIQWSHPRKHKFFWGGVNLIDEDFNKKNNVFKNLKY